MGVDIYGSTVAAGSGRIGRKCPVLSAANRLAGMRFAVED
jgi:hypothetical protein